MSLVVNINESFERDAQSAFLFILLFAQINIFLIVLLLLPFRKFSIRRLNKGFSLKFQQNDDCR